MRDTSAARYAQGLFYLALEKAKIDSWQKQMRLVKKVFKNDIFNDKFKWVYHNAKFDLPVLYNFLGFQMPAPYWDTLIVAYVLDQNEDHGLKALYNKYIAEEDEGINRFDTLFSGITFDNVPLDLSQVYARQRCFNDL